MGMSRHSFFNFKKKLRVNESETEIWGNMYAQNVNQNYVGIPYIEFELIETQLRYPHTRGDSVIGQQIGGSFPELTYQNPEEHAFVNKGDMIFWFNEPLCGWRQGITRYYFLEEIPLEDFEWPKQPKIFDGTLRSSLHNFAEGDLVEGKCDSIHLQHGILVDFGCHFLGLLPMGELAWSKLYASIPHTMHDMIRPDFDRFNPDVMNNTLKCKVRRILDPKFMRWPIELDVVKPSWLSEFVIPIGKYFPRILAVADNLSNLNQREHASHHGRPYRTPRCYAYSSADSVENYEWLQMQYDHYPEDHSQQFKQNDLSPFKSILEQHGDKLARNYDDGKMFTDSSDLHIDN